MDFWRCTLCVGKVDEPYASPGFRCLQTYGIVGIPAELHPPSPAGNDRSSTLRFDGDRFAIILWRLRLHHPRHPRRRSRYRSARPRILLFTKIQSTRWSTPADFERELLGPKAVIEIRWQRRTAAVGFALFFHNFHLPVVAVCVPRRPVREARNAAGTGHALLVWLAQIAVERNCGRF